MTQEDKDLLLKDLCARLPYGVKVNAPFTSNKNENAKGYKINGINFGIVEWTPILFGEKKQRNSIIIESFSEKYNQYCSIDIELNNNIERVKPYLFPVSSMTEEQKNELQSLIIQDAFGASDNTFTIQDFYCKYHLDNRGLIEKDLAIDATNLNIY
jgi:hypothetical protein